MTDVVERVGMRQAAAVTGSRLAGCAGRAADTVSTTNVRQLADAASAVTLNMGTLVGSYATVAAMLDAMAAVPGTGGVLLTFDDSCTGSRCSAPASSR